MKFQLATGNVGVMAATNEVVEAAQFPMVLWLYAAIIVLCLISFRSWRATRLRRAAAGDRLRPRLRADGLSADRPEDLDAARRRARRRHRRGLRHLPLLGRCWRKSATGKSLEDALCESFATMGTSVVFTGFALALGVGTWAFSALKFQADMGVLLAFMFLFNMLGAMLLMPALARWLFRKNLACRLVKPVDLPLPDVP